MLRNQPSSVLPGVWALLPIPLNFCQGSPQFPPQIVRRFLPGPRKLASVQNWTTRLRPDARRGRLSDLVGSINASTDFALSTIRKKNQKSQLKGSMNVIAMSFQRLSIAARDRRWEFAWKVCFNVVIYFPVRQVKQDEPRTPSRSTYPQ